MRLEVPSGSGWRPVPQYSEMSQTENASAESNSEASMYWPWPVFLAPM
jgi:hypothetical protein